MLHVSARDRGVSTETPAALDAEGPLRRWSRRKREAVREKEAAEARGRDASRAPSEAVRDAREPAGDAPAPAAVEEKDPTDEDMPPIDSLDENSDYSGFLSPGVSEGLRRRALRKLFMSAVFNVRDGLDDYDEDFTNFEALGDIVTSDMRHQAEAEAERARRARADTGPEDLREDDSGRAGTGPAAEAAEGEAAEDEADAVRADAAGMPGASGHPPSEEPGVPQSASGEESGVPQSMPGEVAAGIEAGTASGQDGGPSANFDGGARESAPGGRAMAGTEAVSEDVVAIGSGNGEAAGNLESAGTPGPPEPGPPGAGAGDPASDGTDAASSATGRPRA